MRKTLFMISASIMLAACSGGQDIPAVADADSTQVHRVEPLSWWTGMKTSLQLMVQGDKISEYELSVEGGKGVSVSKIHKADSPNFLFADIDINRNAEPGTTIWYSARTANLRSSVLMRLRRASQVPRSARAIQRQT